MYRVCPDCGAELVQMLERKFKAGDQYEFEDNSKHHGFYCKPCKQMFKQKWEFIKDE